MRGFETHEVPRRAFEVSQDRLASLKRPVSGAAFLCAERLSPAGVVHLPSLWDTPGGLVTRCNCPASLAGWCEHTELLAALWMKRPWSFDSEETAPTTPVGSLEPCRRGSRGLDRFESFIGFVLQHGLSRAPLAGELQAIATQLQEEGLDRLAHRLAGCSRLFASLQPGDEPGAWSAAEELLEALRTVALIRELMVRAQVPETTHDEWLGSITHEHSSMPIRHRRYLEVGRSRFADLDGRLVLKRYWIDLATGEAVSDELPEADRVTVDEVAQLLRVRRGELHPGFMPRWLEMLQGQEEPAGAAEVCEALDVCVRGCGAAINAWRKRLALEDAPEDWVGGIHRISLVVAPQGEGLVLDDGRNEPLPLAGGWPSPEDPPPGVLGAFGRLLLTGRGPAFFPLSLLTGEEVLLAPADALFPRARLLRPDAAPPSSSASALVGRLLQGFAEPGSWQALLGGLEAGYPGLTGTVAAARIGGGGPSPGAAEIAAVWAAVRPGLRRALGG